MSLNLDAPAKPDVASEAGLANEVEAWLHALPLPDAPVQWRRRGGAPQPVTTRDQLARLVPTLAEEGAWAVVERVHGDAWGQVMHISDGWIVEVNGIPGPECFARRVTARGDDLISTADECGRILWSWLRGILPGRYDLLQLG